MPKGVMLSHDNMTWINKSTSVKLIENNRPLRLVSYLPLSHAAGQFVDIIGPLMKGHHVFFADPTALQGTLIQTLL
jgi:long-chain-fatty-acid--CoA ligase ACSBG